MNIMFLNGAGGTGKSSIIKELQKMNSSSYHIYTMQSRTRTAYEQLGITDETESLGLDNEMRCLLQDTIMANERKLIEEQVQYIKTKPGCTKDDLLVVDRGPMDRMAYYLLTQMQCKPGIVKPFFDTMRDSLHFIEELEPGLIMHVDFHYPVPWETLDSFRQSNYMQTLALSLMTSEILKRYANGINVPIEFVDSDDLPLGSPSSRAVYLMERYDRLLDLTR